MVLTAARPLLSLLAASSPLLASVSAAPSQRSENIKFESLAQQCDFLLAGLRFDLCPIFRSPARVLKVGLSLHSQTSGRTYGLFLGESVPSHVREQHPQSRCAEGTQFCLDEDIEDESSDSEESATGSDRAAPIVAESSGTARLHFPSRNQKDDAVDASISLQLFGGWYAGETQEIDIHFICAPDAPDDVTEHSLPSFVSYNHGLHVFEWVTRHGCGRKFSSDYSVDASPSCSYSLEDMPTTFRRRNLDSGSPLVQGEEDPADSEPPTPPAENDSPPSESEPSESLPDSSEGGENNENEGEGGDSETGASPHGHARGNETDSTHHNLKQIIPVIDTPEPSIMILFAWAACTIALLGYFIYRPPALFRRWLRRHVNSSQLRTAEVKLVKWAQEDMDLFDEDVMVNGGPHEHIPLKPSPSPRKSGHYGIARS